MYGYIYKTINLITRKIYIGKRVKSQFDTDYKGSGKILKQAINKYGWDNFICEILEWCETKDALNEREKYWIKKLNAQNPDIGYNIANGGEGGDVFNTLSSDQQEKIKETRRNSHPGKGNYKIYNLETNEIKSIKPYELDDYTQQGWIRGLHPSIAKKQGDARRGRKHNNLWVEKFKNSIKNKSEEELQEISRKHSESTKKQMASYTPEERQQLALKGVKAKLDKREGKKVIWVNKDNGQIKKIIFEEDVNKYLTEGFKRGMK